MRITAVVVTYNRLALLQECIGALRQQSFAPAHIIVVDNSSTDGTGKWLKTQSDLEVITQPNGGASLGMYTAMSAAYQQNADWIWAMDDDTVPRPDALEVLVQAVKATEKSTHRFGFFVSRAEWLDGSTHLMNIPQIEQTFNGNETKEWYVAHGLQPIGFCSFVSLLVSGAAIAQAGLPVKEMFIWYDDYEFTTRLRRNGFTGAYVEKSVVLHKTATNYACDVFVDTPANLWKYRYGIRNELYARRQVKGYGSFLRNVFKRLFVMPVQIVVRRKNYRWPFIRTVWKGTWEALQFNPKPEKVQDS